MRNKLGLSEDTLVIGHVGRFCEVKNHIFLIEIFKRIVSITDSKLLLIGDGDLREDIEKSLALS